MTMTAPPPVVTAPVTTTEPTRQTVRVHHPYGPSVTDVWYPPVDSGQVPVLLIHGWGGSGSYWQQTARTLAQAVRVIVPDLPGTGRSQPVKKTRNLYDQVRTISDILDHLEVEQVQIVGHSMGGAMAVLLSAQQPDRVTRLVLTSLTFFMTKRQENIYATVMGVFRWSMLFRPDWLTHVPGISQMMATHYFHRVPDDPPVLRQGLKDYLQLDRATALACAANATDPQITEAGYDVQAPTLLVASRQDQMMPLENVDFTCNIIPDCQVRWIEECGHLPMVEKPAEYMAILTDFLDL